MTLSTELQVLLSGETIDLRMFGSDPEDILFTGRVEEIPHKYHSYNVAYVSSLEDMIGLEISLYDKEEEQGNVT